MPHAWTHSICDACWDKLYRPEHGNPVRMSERRVDACCFCGERTGSGIYVREDPRIPKFCPKDSGNGKGKNA